MKTLLFCLILSLCLSNSALAEETVTVTLPPGNILEWQNSEQDRMNWFEAKEFCRNLTLEGKEDWRLPTVNELNSLVDRAKFDPAIDRLYFPNAHSTAYWSSTTCESNKSYAWGVGFFYGEVGFYGQTNRYHTRCIRTVR